MDFSTYSQAADTKSLIWNDDLQAEIPYTITGSVMPTQIPTRAYTMSTPAEWMPMVGSKQLSVQQQATDPYSAPGSLVANPGTIVHIPMADPIVIPIPRYIYCCGIPIPDAQNTMVATVSGTVSLSRGGGSHTYTSSTVVTVYCTANGTDIEIGSFTVKQISGSIALSQIDLSQIPTPADQIVITDIWVKLVSSVTDASTYANLSSTAITIGEITYPDLEAATQAATEAATQAATEAATQAATEAATQAATEAATQAATEAATQAATEAATQAATEPETTTTTTTTTEGSNM